jgi:hypothetical protein
MVITKTNVRDDKLLAATPDAIVVSVRSQPKKLFNILRHAVTYSWRCTASSALSPYSARTESSASQ